MQAGSLSGTNHSCWRTATQPSSFLLPNCPIIRMTARQLTFSLPSRNSDPDPFACRCWPSGQVCNKQQGVAGSYRCKRGPRIGLESYLEQVQLLWRTDTWADQSCLRQQHAGCPYWRTQRTVPSNFCHIDWSFAWFFPVLTQMSNPPPTPSHEFAKPSNCPMEPLCIFEPQTTIQP
jgi:hypothetical protein